MAKKHPFHRLALDSKGEFLYSASAGYVQKFSTSLGELLASYSTGKVGDREETGSETVKIQSEQNKSESLASEPVNYARFLTVDSSDHVIGITNEDKAVIVWDSNLNEISMRSFAKRPSVARIAKDNQTLLVGDKFGDVYAVPLLSSEPIITSASNGKQHTIDQSLIAPILGHVSMLVDLVIGEHDEKEYVITADRDEHIRVSRYPDSFIIERFLFGHTEFISSLVLISGRSNILISAGGDDFIFVWDWTTGALIDKFDLRALIGQYLNETHTALQKTPEDGETQSEITVDKMEYVAKYNQLVVLCEG